MFTSPLFQPSGDVRRKMMTKIGQVVYEGNSQEKQILLRTLREFYGSDGNDHSATARSSTGYRQNEPDEKGTGPINPGLYSMTVNNYGVKVGAKPMYSFQTLSSDPPLGKSWLCFKGITFEGTGTSVKQAQHEAARLACKHFKLQVV